MENPSAQALIFATASAERIRRGLMVDCGGSGLQKERVTIVLRAQARNIEQKQALAMPVSVPGRALRRAGFSPQETVSEPALAGTLHSSPARAQRPDSGRPRKQALDVGAAERAGRLRTDLRKETKGASFVEHVAARQPPNGLRADEALQADGASLLGGGPTPRVGTPVCRTDGRTGRWADGRADGQSEGWMDGRSGGRSENAQEGGRGRKHGPEFGPPPNSVKLGPMFDRTQPNLADAGQIRVRNLSQIRRTRPEVWSSSAQCPSPSSRIVRLRPELGQSRSNVGHFRPNVGRNLKSWPKPADIGRKQPPSIETGRTMVQVGPKCDKLGPELDNIGPRLVELGPIAVAPYRA